jgi:histidyl-tRNA synthetase
MLAHLGIDERGQALIVGQLEPLARKQADADAVIDRVALLLGAPAEAADEDEESADDALGDLLAQVGPAAAAQLATELLHHASLPLDGGVRSPAEIVQRLLAKAARPDPTPQVRTAIEFLQRLHGLAGPPAEALGRLEDLLRTYGVSPEPLEEIDAALALFARYGARPGQVVVDLSLARGLRYYTGLVFEIYVESAEGPLQVAGGGRYDDLIRGLGGRDSVPACGFSYGLERVDLARATPPAPHRRAVLVVGVGPQDHPAALALAAELRRLPGGLSVEQDVRLRGPKAALRHADRTGAELVLILGEQERAEGTVVLRDMRSRQEQRVPREQIVLAVRQALELQA